MMLIRMIRCQFLISIPTQQTLTTIVLNQLTLPAGHQGQVDVPPFFIRLFNTVLIDRCPQLIFSYI